MSTVAKLKNSILKCCFIISVSVENKENTSTPPVRSLRVNKEIAILPKEVNKVRYRHMPTTINFLIAIAFYRIFHSPLFLLFSVS